jgi:hypothetical protein
VTALQLFHEATRRGLTLRRTGSDKLAVIPARLCPREFAEILREHKPELLTLLSGGKPNNLPGAVSLHRPLTESERVLLVRWCGTDTDPIIFEAINLFNGRIVGIGAGGATRGGSP